MLKLVAMLALYVGSAFLGLLALGSAVLIARGEIQAVWLLCVAGVFCFIFFVEAQNLRKHLPI